MWKQIQNMWVQDERESEDTKTIQVVKLKRSQLKVEQRNGTSKEGK